MRGMGSALGVVRKGLGSIANAKAGRLLARNISRKAGMGFRGRAPLVTTGAAFDASVMLSKLMGRAAGRTINWTGKHYVAATAIGMGTFGTVGAVRGAMAQQRATYPVPQTNKPLPPLQGPGYNVWGSPGKGPMRANNLGATGDLPLALHKTRHR